MIDVDVAIIGGGFSGCAVALQLAHRARSGLTLALFEPGGLGSGAAYGTRHPEHLLNTRASAMSIYPDDPEHFVRWLGGRSGANDFVSRQIYRRYIYETASRAFTQSGFSLIPHRANRVASLNGDCFGIESGCGRRFVSRAVVLATGNPLPDDTFLPSDVTRDPHYIGDPWRCDYRRIDGEVLVIGSGLTALDVLVALHACGHAGNVSLLSRHCRFPEIHADVAPYDVIPALDARTAGTLVRSFRRHVREGRRRGFDWRAIVDALRLESEATWRRLNAVEQRRFERHVRAHWERHRHRAPAQVEGVRKEYDDSGRLSRCAGRLIKFTKGEATILLRTGRTITLAADWIINCSGVGKAKRLRDDPLLGEMFLTGLISAQSESVGLKTSQDCAAIGAGGIPTRGLWVVGPPARGARFEATAVPDLRAMAEHCARQIIGRTRPQVQLA